MYRRAHAGFDCVTRMKGDRSTRHAVSCCFPPHRAIAVTPICNGRSARGLCGMYCRWTRACVVVALMYRRARAWGDFVGLVTTERRTCYDRKHPLFARAHSFSSARLRICVPNKHRSYGRGRVAPSINRARSRKRCRPKETSPNTTSTQTPGQQAFQALPRVQPHRH